MIAGAFVFLKIVHFLLFLMRKAHKILGKCYKIMKIYSRWWVLIVAAIEINANDISFNSALQLLNTGYDSLRDRANFVAMWLILFLVVMHCVGAYLLTYSMQKRKCSKCLIVYMNDRKMGSYFFEPTLIFTRSIIKSFLHGYLIFSYSTQIISLLVVDLVFLIMCLSVRKNFSRKSVFLLLTIYLVAFSLFDLYFVVQYHTTLNRLWDRELIGFVLCCIIAGSSLVLSLIFLIFSLVDGLKFLLKVLKKSTISP